MWFWDPTYVFVLIGVIISAIASMSVSSTFNRFNKVRSSRNLTAQEAAERILHDAGIYDVRIERIRGNLTDHYSPNEKVLRLSDSVYNSTSVAAIGVAAHECGHAIQHERGYVPLKLRSLSVPAANFGSMLYWPLIIIGIILGTPTLAQIGIALFCAVIFFQVVTLPVEFNASRRALAVLSSNGLLYGEELSGARKVLSAAAMTYVAAVFASILQLIRLILIARRSDD